MVVHDLLANHLGVLDDRLLVQHFENGLCDELRSLLCQLLFFLLHSMLFGIFFPLVDKVTYQLSLDSVPLGYIFLR